MGEIQIVHQTGEKDFERVREGYSKAGVTARVEKFIHEMPEMYSKASLVICRAGSSTLSEVAAVGRASVLIPFPEASDNHQEQNARVFSEAGAAILLLQKSAQGADLARAVFELIEHPEKRVVMENTVKTFHKPQSALRIAANLAGPLATSL
jgi:UDP-N-acetylglucosamine--N-acetylmuramyl-(pentapeptide) pyrophosphoryl-undecaprenol N-acetylglucosamine transferase